MAKPTDIAAWVQTETRIEIVVLRRSSGDERIERQVIDLPLRTAEMPDPAPGHLQAVAASFKGDWIVAPAPEDVLMRVIRIPPAEDSELHDIVALQIDKISPFPVETMVVSHEVLKRDDAGVQLLVAATRSEKIVPLQALFSAQGITPSRIDAPLAGWWETLRPAPGSLESQGRRIHLVLEPAFPHLIAMDGDQPLALRSLPECAGLGQEDLIYEIQQTLRQWLSTLELEHGTGEVTGATIWHRDSPDARPLADAIQRMQGLVVTINDIPDNSGPGLGLVRRAAKDLPLLDLTSLSWRDAYRSEVFAKKLRFGAIVVIALWLVIVGVVEAGVLFQRYRFSSLQKMKQTLEPPTDIVKDMRTRVLTVKQYLNQGQSSLECLRKVSELQPQGIDLRSFTYNRKEGRVEIAGEASGAAQLVYDFKQQLDSSGFFGSSKLEGPTLNPQTQKQLFQIDLRLKPEATL